MRISKPLAALIGVATILPAIYMALFFATFSSGLSPGATADEMPIFGTFQTMMAFHLAVMALTVVLLVFYVVHAFKNERLVGDKRVLWVVVIFFGSFVAGIVYWWIYIWHDEPLHSSDQGRDPVS